MKIEDQLTNFTLIFHAVGNIHAAIFEPFAFDEFKINLPVHRVKKRNPRAEQDGMNVETNLVNQTRLEKRLRQTAKPICLRTLSGLDEIINARIKRARREAFKTCGTKHDERQSTRASVG